MTLRVQIGLERWEAIPFTVLWTLSGRNGFSFTLERILQVQKILHWLWRRFVAQWESTLSNPWSKYFCSVTNPKFVCLYDSHYSDLPCGKIIVVAISLIFYEFLKSVMQGSCVFGEICSIFNTYLNDTCPEVRKKIRVLTSAKSNRKRGAIKQFFNLRLAAFNVKHI